MSRTANNAVAYGSRKCYFDPTTPLTPQTAMAQKVEFNMEMVKKYLFWVCVPIGLVVAVAVGWMTIGSIANELKTQKDQLESQKSAIGTLRSGATSHPNQKTIDEINAMRQCQECAEGGDCTAAEQQCLFRQVLVAWETLEREQRSKNQWAGLARVAQDEIASKNFLDPLSSTTLNSYLLFARNAINGDGTQENPGLLARSNIRLVQHYRQAAPDGQWTVPVEIIRLTENRGTGRGESGGAGGEFSGRRRGESASSPSAMTSGPTMLRGKVFWGNPGVDITMKNWTQQPQSFEVWLTQEDLWVYQALFWVVAESNKDVRENSVPVMSGTAGSGMGSGTGTRTGGEALNLRDSVVKEIIDLAIGRHAAMQLMKQSSRSIGRGGFGGEGSDSYGESSSFGGGSMSGFGGGGSFGESSSEGSMAMSMSGVEAAEAAKKFALMGRYVDIDGAPLMEPDFTGQFRRMPVYLNLRVDQRYISDVLVNCANCPMPIDVLWVTVNPDNTQPFDFVPATVAGGMGSSGDSGSFGSTSRGRGGREGGTASRQSRSFGGEGSGMRGAAGGNVDFGPNEVIIEIYGCINIFAPPSKGSISGEDATM